MPFTRLSRTALLGLAAATFLLVAVFSQQAEAPAALPVDGSAVSLRVRFGVTDSAPKKWDGTISATGGSVIALRNWRPRPGDKIAGKTGWSFSTKQGVNFVRRAWEPELPTGPVPYINEPGLVVDAKAGTKLMFKTAQGEFQVEAKFLASPVRALSGAVIIDSAPTALDVSMPGYQNDFPTVAAGANGELWMAWVGYRDKGNVVFARRLKDGKWEKPLNVTPAPGDVFLVKIGRDRNGHMSAIWSAQVDGNWDLYARKFDGKDWSGVERLTNDIQPDVYHNVATDSNGNLWVAWQGFRNGKSDIFARRYDGSSWLPPERVSESPANDWEPAIAADNAGRVYVAWDSYGKGNYDVSMRSWSGGKWNDVADIASTPKYEAHVTLTVDKQDRLWAAWNESGSQWGKDSGFLVRKEATRLYQWRTMAVAVYEGGAWKEPVADVNRSLPADLQEYNDFPVIETDGAGRPWLFFRHRLSRIRDVHDNAPLHRAAWEIYGTSYDGARWSAPIQVPFSQGRTDVRGGFARDAQGNIHAAWATDNRDYEDFLFKRSDVYTAKIPAAAAAARTTPQTARLQPRVQPVVTTFAAHSNEAGDLKRIRSYEVQSSGKSYRIYRGDTHRHTEFSMDGNNDGTLAQTYRYAIDAADLDFLGVSEHNGLGGPDEEYISWLQQQAADVWTLGTKFVPLYAYERSVVYPNGHRNVIFARRGNPTLPIPESEHKGETGAKMLYEYLKKYDGIAISHTSASSMGTDWRDNDPVVEPLVEIYQGDRVSNEYEGAPKAAHRGNLASAPGGFRPAGYVWNALAKGYKLGVQVSSDHLSTHISYACTIAENPTRQGLLDAMRKRHSYGATDNIVLDYRMRTGGTEYLQGDIADNVSGEFTLTVKVLGTAPIRQIDIIRNNRFVHNVQPIESDVSFSYTDRQPARGESYYYVRVIQVDDQMAWSSPIWIRRP